MKRKIGIIVILLLIAVACYFIGQYNVKKSLFSLSEDFDQQKTEVEKEEILYIPVGSEVEGSVSMGSASVTLTFDYEWKLLNGRSLPEDANLKLEITCPELPDGNLEWAFEPGKIEERGKVTVDLKAFKGKEIQMKVICQGDFTEGNGIILKNIYVSKLYT